MDGHAKAMTTGRMDGRVKATMRRMDGRAEATMPSRMDRRVEATTTRIVGGGNDKKEGGREG